LFPPGHRAHTAHDAATLFFVNGLLSSSDSERQATQMSYTSLVPIIKHYKLWHYLKID